MIVKWKNVEEKCVNLTKKVPRKLELCTNVKYILMLLFIKVY